MVRTKNLVFFATKNFGNFYIIHGLYSVFFKSAPKFPVFLISIPVKFIYYFFFLSDGRPTNIRFFWKNSSSCLRLFPPFRDFYSTAWQPILHFDPSKMLDWVHILWKCIVVYSCISVKSYYLKEFYRTFSKYFYKKIIGCTWFAKRCF